jgi:hypothetical protein
MIHPADIRMETLKSEARALRGGYKVGFFSTNQIERWAERWIAALDTPPIELIELATIRNTYPIDVLNLLRALGGEFATADYVAVRLGTMGELYLLNKISLRAALGGIYGLHSEPGISEQQLGMVYYLDDGYDLAVQGYHGSIEAIANEFREFVSPYVAALPEAVRTMIREI